MTDTPAMGTAMNILLVTILSPNDIPQIKYRSGFGQRAATRGCASIVQVLCTADDTRGVPDSMRPRVEFRLEPPAHVRRGL